jgi:hypothetical protein
MCSDEGPRELMEMVVIGCGMVSGVLARIFATATGD